MKDSGFVLSHLGIKAAMALVIFLAYAPFAATQSLQILPVTLSWKQCLEQPTAFYKSAEAHRIMNNIIAHQRTPGGWPKNWNRTRIYSSDELSGIRKDRQSRDATFDNGATWNELRFLARMASAGTSQAEDVFYRGLEYTLKAQYTNGGWPQKFPNPSGYSKHITFNDNAMIGIMTFLKDIADVRPPFSFVSHEYRERCHKAYLSGIRVILDCQVIMDGQKSVWCAQHDFKSLKPAKARSYELPSLSGSESVGITRFLMSIENPSDEIRHSIEAAIKWFEKSKLNGMRLQRITDPSSPKGYDLHVIPDPSAPPIWARFYDLHSNKPIFCSRDGIPKSSIDQISYERRNGYSWLGYYPKSLLASDYPKWKAQFSQPQNQNQSD